jgi:hypothetical protein
LNRIGTKGQWQTLGKKKQIGNAESGRDIVFIPVIVFLESVGSSGEAVLLLEREVLLPGYGRCSIVLDL